MCFHFISTEYCVGSSNTSIDDIVPCIWVAVNKSGTAEIKQGKFWLDGVAYYNISDLRALSEGVYTFDDSAPQDNNFRMEPGRTVFLFMKICNKAKVCGVKLANTLLIAGDNTKTLTTADGQAVSYTFSSTRKKRSVSNSILAINTPAGKP